MNRPVPLFEGRLRIDSASCVDVDGQLDEWSSLVVEADATQSAGRSTFGTALATDGISLYVAGRLRGVESTNRHERLRLRLYFLVADEEPTPPVRQRPPWEITFEIPPDRRGTGETVRFAPPPRERVKDATMHVVPAADGFDLEAKIPWTAFPPAMASPLGLQASVLVERGQARAIGIGIDDPVIAPSPVEQTLLAQFDSEADYNRSTSNHLWLRAGADQAGAADVIGDEHLERIAHVGRHLSICRVDPTPRCQVRDFDGEIKSITPRPIFSRGKSDLIVDTEIGTKDAFHDVLEVMTFGPKDEPRIVLRHEVGLWMRCCGRESNPPPRIDSEVRYERGAIEFRAGKAWKLSRDSYTEPPLGGGIHPLLTPWDSDRLRRFVVQGDALIVAPRRLGP